MHLLLRRSKDSFGKKSAYLELTQHFLNLFDQQNIFYVTPEDAPQNSLGSTLLGNEKPLWFSPKDVMLFHFEYKDIERDTGDIQVQFLKEKHSGEIHQK